MQSGKEQRDAWAGSLETPDSKDSSAIRNPRRKMRLKYNRNSGRIRGKGKKKKARRRKKRDEREISAEQAAQWSAL